MDTNEEIKRKIFEANREMALKLQDTEQYLERKLREIRTEKGVYLTKLLNGCKHERIIEMKDIRAESIIPFFKNISCLRHEEHISCVRVCQICGFMDARLAKYSRFLRGNLDDDHIQHNNLKVEYLNHSHWSVEEYVRLKPL